MFLYSDLRAERVLSDKGVPCPVRGCSVQVERQKGRYQKTEEYKCPKHGIYITPSTFEYEKFEDNLLWIDEGDKALLERIFADKREYRMTQEKSENAAVWNVFRYLEKKGLVKPFLDSISRSGNEGGRVVYWSFDQAAGGPWEPLTLAREEFGEKATQGTEPDLVIETEGNVYFFETRLASGNKTAPGNPDNKKRYETGGDGWFGKVFKTGVDFDRVANEESFYVLMRLWLLGTWIANEKLRRNFFLVNLVLNRKDQDVEHLFGRHVGYNETRAFKRLSWEQIYSLVERVAPVEGKKEIVRYFHCKTLGYNSSGALQRAFSV
ncbi:MAG: hypothetical protein RRA32_02600 [bacterium]|nr:hypothetical protein [bacterium]